MPDRAFPGREGNASCSIDADVPAEGDQAVAFATTPLPRPADASKGGKLFAAPDGLAPQTLLDGTAANASEASKSGYCDANANSSCHALFNSEALVSSFNSSIIV